MNAKDKFLNAKNFTVFYGKGSLKELSGYDIAIIEPMAQDISSIRQLRNSGKIVLAYLSVMEIRPEQAEFKLHKENLLKIDDEYIVNHEFKTYYADLRAKDWMRHLYRKVEIYLTEYGCDGIFLDTIGNLEDYRIPVNMKYILIEEAIGFLEKIKTHFPNSILVQNNGMGLLLNYTKTLIDGVCWENTSFKRGIIGKFNRLITRKLKRLRAEYNTSIFLLTEESSQTEKITRFANRNGFLYYNAPVDYISF